MTATTFRILLFVGATLSIPCLVQAAIKGPYAPDANTVYLFHFNEAAGSTSTVNAGTAGNSAYAWNGSTTTPDAPTTLLGVASYSGFGNAGDLTTNPNAFGYDGNGNGMYEVDVNSTTLSPDGVTSASMVSSAGSFTVEAMVQFADGTTPVTFREILSSDSSGTERGFSFRITAEGKIQFRDNSNSSEDTRVNALIPTSGDHAYDTTSWFHVAYVFDANDVSGPGTGTGSLYWTKLSDSLTTANLLSQQTASTASGNPITLISFADAPLNLGGDNRGGNSGSLQGLIDEVRISNVARGASDFIFGTISVPGDFDGDGNVDGDDFVVWQANFPTQGVMPYTTGDGDGDGDVDGADFVVWQTNYPFTPSAGVNSIPEPDSIWMLLLGTGIAAVLSRGTVWPKVILTVH